MTTLKTNTGFPYQEIRFNCFIILKRVIEFLSAEICSNNLEGGIMLFEV